LQSYAQQSIFLTKLIYKLQQTKSNEKLRVNNVYLYVTECVHCMLISVD
jgi:hypothetical protein